MQTVPIETELEFKILPREALGNVKRFSLSPHQIIYVL